MSGNNHNHNHSELRVKEFILWLEINRQLFAANITVQECESWGGIAPWRVLVNRIAQEVGKFFEVLPVSYQCMVPGVFARSFGKPMVRVYGEGMICVVMAKDTGNFLVRLRPEAGNDPQHGYLTLVPAATGSSSHLAGGGTARPTPLMRQLQGGAALKIVRMTKDGARFYRSYNSHQLYFVEREAELPPGDAYERWVSWAELAVAQEMGFLDEHFAETLGRIVIWLQGRRSYGSLPVELPEPPPGVSVTWFLGGEDN